MINKGNSMLDYAAGRGYDNQIDEYEELLDSHKYADLLFESDFISLDQTHSPADEPDSDNSLPRSNLFEDNCLLLLGNGKFAYCELDSKQQNANAGLRVQSVGRLSVTDIAHLRQSPESVTEQMLVESWEKSWVSCIDAVEQSLYWGCDMFVPTATVYIDGKTGKRPIQIIDDSQNQFDEQITKKVVNQRMYQSVSDERKHMSYSSDTDIVPLSLQSDRMRVLDEKFGVTYDVVYDLE